MVSTPKAPDPVKTAQAQAGVNLSSAVTQQNLNMVDQVNPWGSVDYSQNGATRFKDSFGNWVEVPTFTQTTTFTPQQQAIFDRTQSAQTNLAGIADDQSKWLSDYLKGGVNTSGVPALQGSLGPGFSSSLGLKDNINLQKEIGGTFSNSVGPGYVTSYAGADDFSADRQKVEDAIMGRMQPYQQQDEERLRSQLINQGLRPGTAAWNSEMARQSRAVDDARLGAILAGGEEQSRMVGMSRDAAMFGNDSILNRMNAQNAASLAQANFFNQSTLAETGANNAARASNAQFGNNAALQAGQFNNATRSQGMQEAYAARNQPINEMMALLGGSQVQNPGQMSGATPQASVGGVDYAGMVQDQYQAKLAQSNAMMGGMFGLLGAGASFIPGFGGR